MLNGTYLGPIFFQGCSPGSIGYQIAICFNKGLTGQVNTLKLETKTRVGGFKCHIYINTGMQTGSGNADGCLKGMLLIRIEVCVHGLNVLVGKDILFL